ncbi:PLP-dependent aminotransferase family protein [Burkholderia territorii]|uniref:aminotransferase-like domain-containing protein n=1 Tax=Burkholderia territorii TaxID=1503055 RepID=UPI0018C4CC3F|nr:PLP-dependent aminotransferase family protein [Burkholderia territorii]
MPIAKETKFAYQAVYRYVLDLMEKGALGNNLKLPSLRELAGQLDVSVPTIQYAYGLLEREGKIVSVPKSGYFCVAAPQPEPWRGVDLLDSVYVNARKPGMLALSSDAPPLLLSLDAPLLTAERELVRQYPRAGPPSYQPFGEEPLRQALSAHLGASNGRAWSMDDFYIAPDPRSALDTTLTGLRLGNSVALVESPCSWAVLRLLRMHAIRVIEMPLDGHGDIDVSSIAALIEREQVRLALFSSGVSMPGGRSVSPDGKRALAALFAQRGIWLFENDRYGGLHFGDTPPRFRDFADPARLVVYSGFDKIVGAEAPYGYVLARDRTHAIADAFLARSFRVPPIRQRALARLYASDRVRQHTLALRRLLHERMTQMSEIVRHAGDDVFAFTPPEGGATLWLEARDTRTCMRTVFETLLAQRIVIAPGEVFSLEGRYRHCVRLSFTLDWSRDIAGAVCALATAVRGHASRATCRTSPSSHGAARPASVRASR